MTFFINFEEVEKEIDRNIFSAIPRMNALYGILEYQRKYFYILDNDEPQSPRGTEQAENIRDRGRTYA